MKSTKDECGFSTDPIGLVDKHGGVVLDLFEHKATEYCFCEEYAGELIEQAEEKRSGLVERVADCDGEGLAEIFLMEKMPVNDFSR